MNKWQVEMSRDMTNPNKMSVRPAKTQIILGIRPVWSESSLSHEETLGPYYPLSAQWRLLSYLADAQADLSLRWAHTHFFGFVMWLKYFVTHCKLVVSTVMILSLRTDISWQTVQTQIRLLHAVWSGCTLFANPSTSFGPVTYTVKPPSSNFSKLIKCPNF